MATLAVLHYISRAINVANASECPCKYMLFHILKFFNSLNHTEYHNRTYLEPSGELLGQYKNN